MLVRLACLLQLSSLGFAKALLPSARELCPAVSHAQPLFSPRSHAALGTVPRAALTLGHRPRRGTGVLFSLNGGAVSSTFEASANQPGWVHLLNKALEQNAATTLLAFVALDMGSALVLWRLLILSRVQVDPDFALAFALVKTLRVPRLALDAAGAATLAKAYPSLAAVRLSLLVDAAELIPGAVSGYLKQHLPALRWRQENGGMSSNDSSALAAVAQKKRQKDASSSKQSKGSGAAAEARRVMSNYGLAYMAAKNVIGPVCIAATYGLLKAGGGSGSFIAQLAAKLGLVASTGSGGSGNGAAAAAAAAGDAAATLALACWCSTLLFPFVVLGAAFVGPWIDNAFQRIRGARS